MGNDFETPFLRDLNDDEFHLAGKDDDVEEKDDDVEDDDADDPALEDEEEGE